MTLYEVLDILIAEGQRDRHRPWWRQTTGGLLMLITLAAVVGIIVSVLLG